MNAIVEAIFAARDLLWKGPLIFLLVGIGIYLTVLLRGLQFRYLFHSFGLLFAKPEEISSEPQDNVKGDISGFESLMTALAGAIGTGNITGIATAVMLGGFGALFWMWIVAFIGMATAYAETVLGVMYRRENRDGEMSGGPMYTLLYGLNSPLFAALFALFAAVACLGIGGMVQSNSVVDAVVSLFPWNRLLLGVIIAVLTALVIIGGVKSIGRAAGIMVPFMAIAYVVVSFIVLAFHVEYLPSALVLIFKSAFTGQAAMGGFAGATFMMALQNGSQFGIFANEAGLGSLSIAGASAKTGHAGERGMLAICGVFIGTMIVCTLTGLVLAVSNVVGQTGVNGELLSGSPLALAAFGTVHDSFRYIVTLGLIMFAFTTILAWSYYGEKCSEFLLGYWGGKFYRWIFLLSIVGGAVFNLDLVWAFSHLSNGLMVIPNLFAVFMLSKLVKSETNNYLEFIHPANKN